MSLNEKNSRQQFDNGTTPFDKYLEKFGAKETGRIIRNVLILSFALMIHFTAFHGTSNLQSSVNSDAALGTSTLASIYGSLIISNILLPVIVIRWLGCKWTIVVGIITYMPYIGAQMYPRLFTLIPAGLSVGIGAGPLLCAKCTYLAIAAEAFSGILKGRIKSEVLVVRFFGLFFVFYQLAQVWGNLISSSVLSYGEGNDHINSTVVNNFTKKNVSAICGGEFCPGVTAAINPNLIPPDPSKILILAGIFLGCMAFAAILISFFVDSLSRYDLRSNENSQQVSGCKALSATWYQLIQPYQLLLLPLTMFVGAEQAFITGDFTASFVACGWGIPKIGYAMICFGVANAVAAALAGILTKLTGRFPVMIGVMVVHAILLFYMRVWQAVENDVLTYCCFAALWGLCDGVWLVQVNALSGILFPGKEEAAFSTFRLCEASGSVITYSLIPFMCTGTKIYALLVLMVVGMICYSTIEYLEKKSKGNIRIDTFEPVAREPLELSHL